LKLRWPIKEPVKLKNKSQFGLKNGNLGKRGIKKKKKKMAKASAIKSSSVEVSNKKACLLPKRGDPSEKKEGDRATPKTSVPKREIKERGKT